MWIVERSNFERGPIWAVSEGGAAQNRRWHLHRRLSNVATTNSNRMSGQFIVTHSKSSHFHLWFYFPMYASCNGDLVAKMPPGVFQLCSSWQTQLRPGVWRGQGKQKTLEGFWITQWERVGWCWCQLLPFSLPCVPLSLLGGEYWLLNLSVTIRWRQTRVSAGFASIMPSNISQISTS